MKYNKIDSQLYEYEQKFWHKNLLVCGIDEVGRGCLAGPVVTAAAILHTEKMHPKLKDSKTLSKKNMLEAYQWLLQNSTYSIAINSSRIIDKKNIYQATKITMKQALLHLHQKITQQPSLILIDAMSLDLNNTPYNSTEQLSLIKGESKSASIAAASILAKVTRDQILHRLSLTFPAYNLGQHKGYGTRQHQEVILNKSASVIHRKTYLRNLQSKQKDTHEQKSIFS